MNNKFIDIKNYINVAYDESHIQQSKFISVVDIIYDKSMNLEQLKAIRKSLIFDNDINGILIS